MRYEVLALVVPVCVVSVVLGSVTRASYNSYAGPFTIVFKESTQCPEGTISEGHLVTNLSGSLHHLRSSKGPLVFDGVALVTRDVGIGDLGIKVTVAKWDNVAGWRDNFFRMDGGEYCTVLASIGRQVVTELNRHNPKFPKTCPILKGLYIFNNFSTELLQRYEHFPVFPYGRFRGDLLFYDMKSKNKDIVGCYRGISDIVPKMKKS